MRAHYLQHVPFEGLGSIQGWLEQAGYQITATPFYTDPTLPALDAIDLLVVMGGPMSIHDEAEYPWLQAEKAFVRSAIEAGIPTLGVCLGAQLMADAMGGAVTPNAQKEIGWFPIQATADAGDTFRFPDACEVFHWHGETFRLPPGAVRLARSAACENQAFQLGPRAIGLQFHLETTAESAQAIVSHCADELLPGHPYIQDRTTLLAAPAERYAAINLLMGELLGYLTRPAEHKVRIAVASRDGESVSGHIGKCAEWILFEGEWVAQGEPTVRELQRIHLPKELVFHYYKEEGPHPLGDCVAVIGASAGDSFVAKMGRRGIEAILTAESDPAKAVADYLRHQVTPPKPRPIGRLICKLHDALSSH